MQLVGVSEAAKALGVNKSTISRQVAKGIIPNHAEPGKPPLIDIDEARAARRTDIDTSKSATPGVGLRGDSDADLFAAASDEGIPSDDAGPVPDQSKLSYNTARTAVVALQAQQAQMNLLRELKQLVPASEVERAAQDHARMLRDRLIGLPQQIAGSLAGLDDERKIIALLTAAIKDCLSAAVKDMDADPTGELGHV